MAFPAPLMARSRRILLFAPVLLLALALIVWLALSRPEDWLRPLLEDALKQRLTEPLTLRSAEITFEPSPALTLGGLRIGDPAQPLVALERLVIASGNPTDLADGRIDTVSIEGLRVNLSRDREGRWNLAGLMRPGEEPEQAWFIGRLLGRDIEIAVQDRGSELSATARLEDLEVGPLGPGHEGALSLRLGVDTPAPAAASGAVQLGGGYRLDDSGKSGALHDVVLTGALQAAHGEASDVALSVDALRPGADGVGIEGLKLSGLVQPAGRPAMQLALFAPQGRVGTHGVEAAALGLALHQHAPAPAVRARLGLARLVLGADGALDTVFSLHAEGPLRDGIASAALTGRAHGEFESGALRLSEARLAGTLPLAGPKPASLDLALTSEMRLRPAEARAGEVGFEGRFDRSRVAGTLEWRQNLQPPLRITTTADRVDVDRYLPRKSPSKIEAGASLPDWRELPLQLDLSVGELRTRGMVVRKARLRLD